MVPDALTLKSKCLPVNEHALEDEQLVHISRMSSFIIRLIKGRSSNEMKRPFDLSPVSLPWRIVDKVLKSAPRVCYKLAFTRSSAVVSGTNSRFPAGFFVPVVWCTGMQLKCCSSHPGDRSGGDRRPQCRRALCHDVSVSVPQSQAEAWSTAESQDPTPKEGQSLWARWGTFRTQMKRISDHRLFLVLICYIFLHFWCSYGFSRNCEIQAWAKVPMKNRFSQCALSK